MFALLTLVLSPLVIATAPSVPVSTKHVVTSSLPIDGGGVSDINIACNVELLTRTTSVAI